MGRKTELTPAQIGDAIEQLLQDGAVPSWEAVREIVGSGSPVVLNRMIHDWYKANGRHFAKNIPPEPTPSIRSYLEMATADAMAAFEKQQAARVAELDERNASLDAWEQVLTKREAALDARESGLRELVDHHREQASLAGQERDAALSSLAQLQVSLATARADADRASERVTGLTADLERMREQSRWDGQAAAALQADVAAANARSEAAELARVALDRRLAETLQAMATLEQRFAAEAGNRDRLLSAAHEQLADLKLELEEARAKGREKDDRNEALAQALGELREQLASRDTALEMARAQHEQQETAYRAISEGLAALRSQQAAAETRAIDLAGTLATTERHLVSLENAAPENRQPAKKR